MDLRIKIELFTFPFVRAKIVKSAYFWLFVNEVILAAWNHLAHAQHEVFVSDPTWHPSEVRILLWLWCLQEVLRATKNLAKIIHKSLMNTKTLPTKEQLPDQPGTFLWAPGCTWKKTTRGQGREKRSVSILPIWPAFISLKSQFAICGCYHAVLSPCRNDNHGNLHTTFEQIFVKLSGRYWIIRIANLELIMCQGMFWTFYVNQLIESLQSPD